MPSFSEVYQLKHSDSLDRLSKTFSMRRESEGSLLSENTIDNNQTIKSREQAVDLQDISLKPIWFINCKRNVFDDSKICYLKGNDLWIFLINGKYSVVVGSDHYPKTRAGLRIDNNKPVYGYEGDFSNSTVLINQFKKGKFAYTRYQEWPYLYQIDKKTDLEGFNEKFNEMLKRYKTL